MNWLDTIVPAFAALALVGVRAAKPGCFYDDYLSKKSTGSLRGLFAVTVVLHHLSSKAYSGAIFPTFSYVGYLSVAVFFFLSGYGLMTSLSEKGQGYIRHLALRRLPRLIIIYLIFTALYSAAWLALGYRFTVKYVLWSFISGSPIVTNSWYILTLVLMYICFCIVFALFRNKRAVGAAVILVFQIIYTVLLHKLGYEYHWYMSCLPFSLGLFWSIFKDRLDGIFRRRWWLYMGSAVLLFAACYVAAGMTMTGKLTVFGLGLGTRMLSAVLFSVAVVLGAMKLKLGNRALKLLGEISLELYLVHGLVYSLLRCKLIYITSDLLWVFLSVVLSIALAYGLYWIFKRILR